MNERFQRHSLQRLIPERVHFLPIAIALFVRYRPRTYIIIIMSYSGEQLD